MRRRNINLKIPAVFSPMPPRYVLVTRRHIKWFLLFSSTLICICWILFGGFFQVQELRCQKGNDPCDQTIQAELDRFKGSSILTTRWQPIGDKLSRADPAILGTTFIPHLPNAMEVRIEVREPEVRLRSISSTKALLVDKDGFVFALAQEKDTSLPEIIAEETQPIEIGGYIENPRLHNAVTLALLLKTNFIPYQRIVVDKDGITVFISEGIPVLFSIQGDISQEVTTLQRILSQATIERKPTKIDVRYSKPVISY